MQNCKFYSENKQKTELNSEYFLNLCTNTLVYSHLHYSFELGDVKRFLKEIVGLGFAGQLGDIAVGAEEYDGNIMCFGGQLECPGSFDATGAGYPVIHEDDIGLIDPDLIDDLVGGVQCRDVKAFFLQNDGADLQDVRIVIQYQYPFIHNMLLLQIST